MISNNERKMLSEMLEVNNSLKDACSKLANLRYNIEKKYKDTIPASAYRIISNSDIASEIAGLIAMINMQGDKYLECINGRWYETPKRLYASPYKRSSTRGISQVVKATDFDSVIVGSNPISLAKNNERRI